MARSYVVEGLHPGRNAFNLSHNHFTTMDFGYVYPIAWFECVPGDVYDLYFQSLFRVLAMVAPILNNITVSLDVYFCPTRLLWKDWEKFITTVDDETIPPKTFEKLPPTWMEDDDGTFKANIKLDTSNGSLWRCFGLNSINNHNAYVLTADTSKFMPIDFLRRMYWNIYNNWYRDENLQQLVNFIEPSKDQSGLDQQRLFRRAWKKDYFTAAFTSQQKGLAPAIPVSGTSTTQIKGTQSTLSKNLIRGSVLGVNGRIEVEKPPLSGNVYPVGFRSNGAIPDDAILEMGLNNDFIKWFNENNEVDNRDLVSLNMADLRDMSAIQVFFERLMRFGSRYIEYLQGFFGVSPSDARLSIPERIGGADFNLNISEVIQTSETSGTSPQGNQAGHANGLSEGKLGAYKCEEFGYIMILADIKPPAVYSQRMPRELMRKTLLDQVNPAFVNLSYQGIRNSEIFWQCSIEDEEIWAFQGRYDECREKQSYVSGQLLDTQSYYLNQRLFDSLPGFNAEFIECNPNKDIFAVTDEDPFICNFYFDVKAVRPFPLISEPGRMDHIYGE